MCLPEQESIIWFTAPLSIIKTEKFLIFVCLIMGFIELYLSSEVVFS